MTTWNNKSSAFIYYSENNKNNICAALITRNLKANKYRSKITVTKISTHVYNKVRRSLKQKAVNLAVIIDNQAINTLKFYKEMQLITKNMHP